MRSFILLSFLILTECFSLKAQKSDSTATKICYILDEIELLGNHRTKSSIITRELPHTICDTLKTENLDDLFERYRQNIFNTNLFVWVKISHKINEFGGIKVKIEVKEPWYFLAAPVAFLADRNINEWWYDRNRDLRRITYGLYAKHQNLTGNNDQLRIKVFGGFIPYVELSYRKPYIDRRQRMGIQVGLYYSQQRSMPYRTWNDKLDFVVTDDKMKERKGIFFEYSLRNKLYHYHKIDMNFENLSLNDTIINLNPNFLPKNKNSLNFFAFNYQYLFDKRDNRQYPLKGTYFSSTLSIVSSAYKQSGISINYSKFIPIHKNLYFDFTLKTKFSIPKKQLYPFIRGIGYGTTILRGYELYVIDGQDLGLLKTNLKYQIFKRTFDLHKLVKIKQFNSLPIQIFATSYFDGGYVKNYSPLLSNSKLSNKVLNGGGFGLDLVTWYNSILKLNYSINQLGEKRFYVGMSKGIF